MSSMASVTVLVVISMAFVPALMASDYTVGDSSGWTTGVDYDTWASDKTFKVGDMLLFSYGFLHSVSEVTKNDYDSCSSSNAIQSSSDQNTKITLDKPGTRYFICGTPTHCSGGMKFAITTLKASSDAPSTDTSPPLTASSNSSPNSPSTPTESSPNSPSAQSTPSDGTPKKNTPTTTGVNAASSGGFSCALMVGVSLVGAALMGY